MVQFLSKEDLQKLRFKNQRANEQVRIATDKRIDTIKNNKQTISDNPRHDLYNDLFTDGNIINYPHGRVMMFGQKPYFWRGQIKDYGTCISSLTRHFNSEKSSDSKIEIFVNCMKLYDFNELLCQFKQVKEWPFGDVFTWAIAQHYGFKTNIIDFTNELEIALFFACCKHVGDNKYRPLCKEDIKEENDKYGFLIKKMVDTDLLDNVKNNYKSIIYPIGFQPFTRCHRQRGYFVYTDIGDDLQKSDMFTFYRFKHSVELSEEIYDKFNGGEDLFFQDALDSLKDLINSIKDSIQFSKESFNFAYNKVNNDLTENKWISLLDKKMNIEIGNKSYNLSRQRRRAIDRRWSVEKFIKEEQIAPGYRMCYTPE